MGIRWRQRMLRKAETFVEEFFDEMQPYIRLFVRLAFIWGALRLFRAFGMKADFLDWIEHAEMIFTEFMFVLLLLDSALGFVVERIAVWRRHE